MRNQYFDIIKGFAIFLVVLGHVIQSFVPNYEKNSLFLFIYSFHMPLFIAVSGYFFLRSVDKTDTLAFIKSKFQHLMLPSLTMGALNCFLISVGKLMNHKELDPVYFLNLFFTGLWFLSVLFILSVLGCLLRKFFEKQMYICWIVIVIALYFCPSIWLSHELKYLTPFFVGAMALNDCKWNEIPCYILVPSLLIFVVMLIYFDFGMTLYKMDDNVFSIHHLNIFIYRFFIGLFGCISSLFICRLFLSFKWLCKWLCVIGTSTLPIYALHQKLFLWNMLVNMKISNLPLLLMLAIGGVACSLLLYMVLRKNAIFAFFLFGEARNMNLYNHWIR